MYRVARDQAVGQLVLADAAVAAATHQTTEAELQHEAFVEGFGRRAAQADRASQFELFDAERQCAATNIATARQRGQRAETTRGQRAATVAAAERKLALADRLHQRAAAALQRAIDRAEQATVDDLAPTRIKDDP